jgi:hypothetical protein
MEQLAAMDHSCERFWGNIQELKCRVPVFLELLVYKSLLHAA